MKILVACEESQTVTKEFRKLGHEAYSCDILECSGGNPEWHIKDDALDIVYGNEWDMLIAHPPCTYLTVAGNKWFKPEFKDRFPDRQAQRAEAVSFFMQLMMPGHIDKVAVENPIGIMSTQFRKPNQIVHPYHFGDPVSKATCLWLKNLPVLNHTNVVEPEWYTPKKGKRMSAWHVKTGQMAPDKRRKERSKTFPGIAEAMAVQWGK